jgi:hypothetical protein
MFHVKHFFNFLFFLVFIPGKAQKIILDKELAIHYPEPLKEIVQFNERQEGYFKLSEIERQFFYWVNYSRKNPQMFYDSIVVPVSLLYPQLKGQNLESLQSEMRYTESLPLFILDSVLSKMANSHASDLAIHNMPPSHSSSNGENFSERFKKYGLMNCGGENISFGSLSGDPVFMLVLLYLDLNVSNLGHRKALLNPIYLRTGIASASYENGNTIIVQDFACKQE